MRKPTKLTWQQAQELRLLAHHKAATYRELAAHFGISTTHVAALVRGVVMKDPTYRPEHKSRAKLDWLAVREIRRRYAEGERGVALAREFGVSNVCVHYIITRKNWRNDPLDKQQLCKAA
jgi:hypothetical protein